MRNLALGALFVGLVVACGGGKNNNNVMIIDSAGSGDASTVCNPLAQTGCQAGEKCTWILDTAPPNSLGHVGCAPDGTIAIGAACTSPVGGDMCIKGSVCVSRECKEICDNNGGAPMCPTTGGASNLGFSCGTYSGLFGAVGQPVVAGVCDPNCNPLTDNNFLGPTGTKTGSACSATQGCYGFPESAAVSKYTCSTECAGTGSDCANQVYRSVADTTGGGPYLNGCAQGYVPLMYDKSGSMTAICVAMCQPGDCYPGSGNCGTNPGDNLIGLKVATGMPSHRCNSTDARGAFNPATETMNRDQCMYSWLFEVDNMGVHKASPESNLLGFCVDHSKYLWDSNGDGMLTMADKQWTRCDNGSTVNTDNGFGATDCGPGANLVCGGAAPYTAPATMAGQSSAADFGCISTTLAGVTPFSGKATLHALVDRPRAMYNHDRAQ